MTFIERVGKGFLRGADALGRDMVFIGEIVYWSVMSLTKPKYLKRLVVHSIEQFVKVGADSLPVVTGTALFTGMALALQSHIGFRRFGAETLVGAVVALSMTRELGPVLSSIMIAGRAGSAMAAELGTMRVTEQIDALSTMAVNPVRFLVVPRVVASIIALPLLVCLTDIIGILGGFIVGTKVLGGNPVVYMKNTWQYLTLSDFYVGLLKAAVFGFILSSVSCGSGFQTIGGAEGVGVSTTRAVVYSSLGILVANYFLTALLF